ncbi:Sensor histidine kinase DesK [Streptomyces sp. MBT84]|nr:Sensor histidine kinase DesK [Streptomyces sp. MBT84]
MAEDEPVQAITTSVRPRRGERIIAALNRDPRTAPHGVRNDALLAVALAVSAVCLGLLTDQTRRPDALGWTLLLAAHVPIVWRRRRPLLVLAAVVALVAPYHALDNNHGAPLPASFVALYTVAVTGRPLRTILTGTAVLGIVVSVMLTVNAHQALGLLRVSGWVIAVLFFGVDVRYYRHYVASIVERAERAERTREEEARRRVAEERVRIARDLHDLLAHSITLIGVQTSVAVHVLAADPERLDRAAIARALEDIAETCRTARGNCAPPSMCCVSRARRARRAGRCPASTASPTSWARLGSPAPASGRPSGSARSRPPWVPPRTASCRRR